jgi:DnaJ like chaperone protein
MSIWSRLSAVGDSVSQFLSTFSLRAPPPEKSVAFTIGLIALGAKMARADGEVTGAEVKAFKEVFRVPEEDMAGLERVFNLAKQDVAGYDSYARQVAKLFSRKAGILENVLDGLFHIAKSDGVVHETELAYLLDVAGIFGFEDADFARIQARHVVRTIEDPYLVLGVDRSATMAEIKAKYRKLAREHHPDKQIAAGVPEEMVSLATDRLARINAAYDDILRERGA